MLDLDKTTTTKVYTDDMEYMKEKVIGACSQDRIHKLVELHQRQVKDKVFQRWIITQMGRKLGETEEQIEDDLKKYTRDIL